MESNIIVDFCTKTVKVLKSQSDFQKKNGLSGNVTIELDLKEVLTRAGANNVFLVLKEVGNNYQVIAKFTENGDQKELAFLPERQPTQKERDQLVNISIDEVRCVAIMHSIYGEPQFRCRWKTLITRKEIQFSGPEVV